MRALRGGEPSCAAASQAETSGTVGPRPEQSSLRRRNELEGRGCALFLSPVGHEADEPAAQEGARGKQFRSAAIFGHSRALRETEKPAAQEGARGRREPTPWTMLLMESLTLAYVRCMCTPRGCLTSHTSHVVSLYISTRVRPVRWDGVLATCRRLGLRVYPRARTVRVGAWMVNSQFHL